MIQYKERKIFFGFLGAGLMVFLYACGEVGGSGQCGGVSDSGACIRIGTVAPDYLGGSTSNVDVVQDICDITDEGEIIFEPFTDHDAVVTISNSTLPGFVGDPNLSPIVTFQDYNVTFTLNDCPPLATCPAIDSYPVEPGQTVTIDSGEEVSITLPMMPLRKKFEFVDKGGSLFEYPSYTARYIIKGTDTFNEGISVTGFTEFTIGNYDNCP